MNTNGNVDVIVDGQWGSTGKGKLAAYLALRTKYDLAISHNGPNAGHTYVSPEGEKVVCRQLPSSLVKKDILLVLGAGAIIDPDVLLSEIEEYDDEYDVKSRLVIHPQACVVDDECKEKERERLQRISSTCKGTGAALARRVWREPSAIAANCDKINEYVGDAESTIRNTVKTGGLILIEGSQGFDLSVIHGQYPHCTSRDTTAGSYLSWSGIPHHFCRNVYGALRTYPIRVGNTENPDNGDRMFGGMKWGCSGPCYDDQKELTWEDIEEKSGYADKGGLEAERTTVTKKVRRVFNFSWIQLSRFVWTVGPTDLFINFVNYWDASIEGVEKVEGLIDSQAVTSNVNVIEESLPYGCRVTYLGTGPKDNEMVEI